MQHPIYDIVPEDQAEASAWVFSSPDKFERIYYKHPELQENYVRVRILSAGLCLSDSLHCRGKWGQQLYPVCPGHEIVGEVEALGSQVTKFQIGEKVMLGPIRDSCGKCEFCLKGITNACEDIDSNEKFIYGLYWGGYSTHTQHPESHILKLPENLDYKEIAPIMCAGITTFVPLFAHLKKGDTVAVVSAGGLGHLAIQFAKKMGCKVDVFSSSHNKDEVLKQLGADDVVIWTKDEHLQKKGKYNAIIYTAPLQLDEKQLKQLLECLKQYGVWIQVGLPEVGSKLIIEPEMLVLKNMSVVGSLVGGLHHFEEMLKFVAEHEGIKVICEHYDFEDFDKALEKLEHGQPQLRCVVDTWKFSEKFKPK